MEDCLFVVVVQIGLQTKFEFECTLLHFDADASKFTFGECDKHLLPVKDGDMFIIDLARKSAAFNSGHLSMVLDILTHKKVGDNYHFRCATDLCRVDAFVCKKTDWEEKRETIFS